VHDEGPQIQWRLAVIEKLNKGGDGMTRSADIRTSSGRTNRPIVKLYPPEVTSNDTEPVSTAAVEEQASTASTDRPPK